MERDHAPTTFQFFQSLDSNRSGVLTKDELIAAFAEHDLELTAEELTSLLVDLGGAGTDAEVDVQLVDFMDAIQRARQQIAGAQSPRADVAPTGVPRLDLFSVRREARTWPPVLERLLAATEAQQMQLFAFFRALDTDNSGAVSISELRAAFVRFGVPANAYELKELLTALDQDGDGEVELVEFMDAVHQARMSRAAHRGFVGHALPSAAAADSSHISTDARDTDDKLWIAPEPELQRIGVLPGPKEGAAAVCCADIRAYMQGLRLWKIYGRTRFPAFLGLLCSLTLPMLDVATDWAVTWSFYITRDLNWFKTSLTIQLLSGSLSGILLAAIDFHEKLGKLFHSTPGVCSNADACLFQSR